MDPYHQQHEEEEEGGGGGGGKLKEETKEGSSSTVSPVSPSSTSPSHEFSFTISLHSPSDYKTKTQSAIAVDLSPADDIFFHGHLLPLHLISNLPVSPRLSTTSLDSFNVPGTELFDDPKPLKPISKSDGNIRKHDRFIHGHHHHHHQSHAMEAKVKNKSKSFSLFGLKRVQKVRVNVRETEENENQERKMRFDVLKRYMRMITPLLSFRRKKAYSFSDNLSLLKKKTELTGRRGEYYSAPPSTRTSPSNSGLLVGSAKGFPSSTSDSTMEELQAAIQSAIAHCKNSIKGEEKLV